MVYEFGEFALDTRRHELRRGGEPKHLEPQVYAVLCHLLEHRDRLVTSKELIDEVWGHRFVTPGTLNSRIKALRQALGDDGAAQRVIQTVRGRGFRLVVEVRTVADTHRTSVATAPLRWRRAPDSRSCFAARTTACASRTRRAAISRRPRW